MTTIEELEAAMRQAGLRGIQVSFGQSISLLKDRGEWFANASTAREQLPQVRGESLSAVLTMLLPTRKPRHDPLDDIL